MRITDTIVAIATPPGEGGIGVVRVSGPEALSVGRRVFSRERGNGAYRERRLYYGRVKDPVTQKTLDDCLMAFMKGPRSYTGEDTVEFYCHGGALVLKGVLGALMRSGARLAEPGEFTKQAFLNGRLDLAQAEAVIDIIRAKTEAALLSARARLEGAFSSRVNGIKESLVGLLARIEALLDFPEEDGVGGLPREVVLSELEAAEEKAKRLLLTYEEGRALREGIGVLILGRPNVGKSSLLNILLREERAIVTPIPGTTRDIIEEVLNIGGVPLRLMDTAGLRETTDFVESIGVKAAKERVKGAGLVLFVIDSSSRDFSEDLKFLEEARGKKVIIVANKTDLVDEKAKGGIGKVFSPMGRVSFISALKEAGIGDLERAVYEEALGRSGADADPGEIVASARHRDSLEGAIKGIERAREGLLSGMEEEFLASDLRAAIGRLGEITGEVTTEDILDRIFSEFCIGK